MFHQDSNNSAPNNRSTPGIKRREEYAQATQQAIVDAARRLFSERGYFSTKVDDIAALAARRTCNRLCGITWQTWAANLTGKDLGHCPYHPDGPRPN
jgi:Bacterial regulatory proteins, tetR family